MITGRPPGVPLSMINHLDRQLEPSQVNLLKCRFAPTKINDWIMTIGQLFGDILISLRKRGVLQSMIGHMDRQLEPSQVNLLKVCFFPTKINDWIMTLGQLFGDILISFKKEEV